MGNRRSRGWASQRRRHDEDMVSERVWMADSHAHTLSKQREPARASPRTSYLT